MFKLIPFLLHNLNNLRVNFIAKIMADIKLDLRWILTSILMWLNIARDAEFFYFKTKRELYNSPLQNAPATAQETSPKLPRTRLNWLTKILDNEQLLTKVLRELQMKFCVKEEITTNELYQWGHKCSSNVQSKESFPI